MKKIFYKIFIFCIIFFYHSNLFPKNYDTNSFNKKIVSNYFSALISSNNDHHNSLKFFNSSIILKESHQLYLKKYQFSLVLNEKVPLAIKEIKQVDNKIFSNFFEAQLLLALEHIKKKDYEQALIYINKLKKYNNLEDFDHVIPNVLEEYVYLFINNEISPKFEKKFGNLSLINIAFQNCYLEKTNTSAFFDQVINSTDNDQSRYLFFYLNYLISQNNVIKAKKVVDKIDPLASNLLITQAKEWIYEEKFEKFNKIFSCKNPSDIIAEFFFLISNLYSSENNLIKSNYYFNLSKYLNPRFIFNQTLLVENYFKKNEFTKTRKILNFFKNEDKVYHWYKVKKITDILRKEGNKKKSFNYIDSEFKKIKEPSIKIIFDMGNIAKIFEKYDLAIEYYSKVLSNLNPETLAYADVLFRRGGSYERLGKEKKSDEDLLKSLEINKEDPHVLNYLAYSWLERNYKIDTAMIMLEKAFKQEPENPYIIDSIGWAYYLTKDYDKAEILLRKATKLMPDDPIVNDHYADILWKLNRKIQANYFWNKVLNFEDTEEEMKEEIYYKLLKGPKNI